MNPYRDKEPRKVDLARKVRLRKRLGKRVQRCCCPVCNRVAKDSLSTSAFYNFFLRPLAFCKRCTRCSLKQAYCDGMPAPVDYPDAV